MSWVMINGRFNESSENWELKMFEKTMGIPAMSCRLFSPIIDLEFDLGRVLNIRSGRKILVLNEP